MSIEISESPASLKAVTLIIDSNFTCHFWNLSFMLMKSDVPGSYYTINVSSWLFNPDSNDYPECINGLQTSEVEKKMATLMMKVTAVTLLLTFPVVHSDDILAVLFYVDTINLS